MQILIFGLEKAQSKITYFFISGVYSFVAKVYDIMLGLTKDGTNAGTIEKFTFSDIATVMYTIAGIFMLFRVTIAMINMLINPDAINDGKAGAGKLITRIVTSILMLIAFIPNGFVFGSDGILNRLEGALLAEDGLISNIMPEIPLHEYDGSIGAGDTTVDTDSSSSSSDSNGNDSSTSGIPKAPTGIGVWRAGIWSRFGLSSVPEFKFAIKSTDSNYYYIERDYEIRIINKSTNEVVSSRKVQANVEKIHKHGNMTWTPDSSEWISARYKDEHYTAVYQVRTIGSNGKNSNWVTTGQVENIDTYCENLQYNSQGLRDPEFQRGQRCYDFAQNKTAYNYYSKKSDTYLIYNDSNVLDKKKNKNKKSSLFVEDVYAAAKDSNVRNCYYVYLNRTPADVDENAVNAQAQKSGGGNEDIKNSVKASFAGNPYPLDARYSPIHITFYNSPSGEGSGKNKLCTKSDATGKLSNCNYSYTVDTSDGFYDVGTIYASAYDDGWTGRCPHWITRKKNGSREAKADYQKGDSWNADGTKGITGGWWTLDNMKKALKEAGATMTGTTDFGDEEIKKKADLLELQTYGESTEETKKVMKGNPLRDIKYEEAIRFAQMSMGTFMTCTGNADCPSLKSGALIGISDDKIVDGLSSREVDLNFLPSLIAGVGILIWVLVLCVDVIIRRFKLLMLQMIAPIPIISYVDPNDKMFDQWRKMYFATYVDLFLKLIAIAFAVNLLQMVDVLWDESSNLIEKFFYIVAILVFAKAIPSMLSKLFGIDSLGGNFKDITGMGKAALGFGAGAAIGGVVGAATGAQAGNGFLGKIGSGALGGVKGTLLGAGSGSKGNLTGGAKSVAATNALKAQGLNWFDRMRYQGLGALGIDPNISQRHDLDQIKQAKEQVKNINSRIGDVESAVDRTPEVEAFKRAITNGVVSDPTGAKLKALKEAYGNAYDNAQFDKQNNKYFNSTISFSDIGGGISESDFKAVYGEAASSLTVANNSWGSGYRDAVASLENALSMANSDRESVNYLNKYTPDQAKVLLGGLSDENKTFKYITGTLKPQTFTPMKKLDDIEVAKAQELSFSERKTKAGK